MMERDGGRVVSVSSRGAFRGEPETPAYGASKAGLNAMSQSMAQALAPHGVFFYVVAPGFVETDMANPLLRGPRGDAIRSQSPLGRVAAPEEVARTVAFLASEAPDFMTGAIVDVNGASYLSEARSHEDIQRKQRAHQQIGYVYGLADAQIDCHAAQCVSLLASETPCFEMI